MRDPILHIKRSDLINLLGNIKDRSASPTVLADELLLNAKPVQLRGMYIIKSSGKTKKKLEKTVAADPAYVEKFNGFLVSLRQSANHKFVKVIRKEDPSYILLKEVANLSHQFAVDYGILPVEEGYKQFISIGLELMGKKYGLNKFKYYRDTIAGLWEAHEIINKDPAPKSTKEFYEQWRTALAKYATLKLDLEHQEEYAHIVLARIEADEHKADYKQWIVAQFEGLAFLNAIPELSQLYGRNAVKRYQRYTTTVKPVDTGRTVTKFASAEQEEYFRIIRERKATKE